MALLTDYARNVQTLSSEVRVKTECLPFGQIPHTTRLFADFLSGDPKVQPFYSRSAQFSEWFKDEAVALRYDDGRRVQVAAILGRQNRNLGASVKTLENVARLRAGASVVVTGQQVGFFGGPAFALYKALTAVKLASEASAGGVDCVPVFWLATTDHDLEEVSHTFAPGPDGGLVKLETSSHGAPDAPVGTVVFGAEIEPVVQEAASLLGEAEVAEFLRESYRPGETLGTAFARLFAKLFADWGVILLDAADPELNALAAPIYRAAIEKAAQLDDALLARGTELEAAGYHQQVKVTPSSTLLFALKHGARVVVHRRSNGTPAEDEFVIGEEKLSKAQLLEQIAEQPQNFNANVLLRPVVEDYLLPTLAYTGGAAEVAYFAQAAVVYEALLGRVTPILPRFSATIVEPKPQKLLDKYGVRITDLFAGPEHLRETLARHVLPSELQNAFDRAKESVDWSMASIRESLERLDKTLLEASDNAASKIQHQLEQLRSRAARAELRQSEIVSRHADLLSNALYPEKALQEREVAGIYFLSRYGQDLLHQLYEAMHTDCHDHQVISLEQPAA
jgi:bacillithiol synthase